MKIKKNHLKELIRQSIKEIDFKNQAAFDAYNKKHKMRKSTKVNVGGKDTTAGDVEKKGKKTAPFSGGKPASSDEPFDVGGPSYPNVPKGVKTSKDAKGIMKAKQLAKKGMEKGRKEPKSAGQKQTDSFENMEKIKFDLSSKELSSDDYDKMASSIDNLKGTDIMKDKEFNRLVNSLEKNQDRFSAESVMDYLERWMSGDTDTQMMSGDKKDIDPKIDKQTMGAADDANLKMDRDEFANKYSNEDSKLKPQHLKLFDYSLDDEFSEEKLDAMDAKDLRNLEITIKNTIFRLDKQRAHTWHVDDKEMGKQTEEAIERMQEDLLKKEWEVRRADMVRDGVLKREPKKESVKESKRKRFTVKEVQKWMKTLEENRYKRVYNADCRRVSWMANNMKEDIQNMPKSMSKKWTKAQYGRERYLAKEFLKSKLEKLKEQFNRQKLRNAIREIIKEQLNEGKFAELYMKNDMGTKKKVSKIIKKMRLKIDKDYDVKALDSKGKEQKFMILPKHRNEFLELLLKNKIKVRG